MPRRRPHSFSLDEFRLVGPQCIVDRLKHRPQLSSLGIRLDEIDHPPQDGPLIGIEVAGRSLLHIHQEANIDGTIRHRGLAPSGVVLIYVYWSADELRRRHHSGGEGTQPFPPLPRRSRFAMPSRPVRSACKSRHGLAVDAARGVSDASYSLAFSFASFAVINARISSDISRSLSHCSLYKVTGKRPMP